MIKVTKQNIPYFSYVVFLSSVMRHFTVDLTNEVTRSYNKTNLIFNLALHHMGIRKSEIEQAFKDEHLPMEGEDIEPINVDASNARLAFQPKTDFERFMVKQMKIQQSGLINLRSLLLPFRKKLEKQDLDDEFDDEDIFEGDREEDSEDEYYINISD